MHFQKKQTMLNVTPPQTLRTNKSFSIILLRMRRKKIIVLRGMVCICACVLVVSTRFFIFQCNFHCFVVVLFQRLLLLLFILQLNFAGKCWFYRKEILLNVFATLSFIYIYINIQTHSYLFYLTVKITMSEKQQSDIQWGVYSWMCACVCMNISSFLV